MVLNWVDLILLVILILTLIMGILRGFMRQIIGIITVVIGLILAVHYYKVISQMFSEFLTNDFLADFIGFLIIFVVVLVLGWLLSLAVPRLLKGAFKGLDHVLGGLFGFVKGVFICGVLLFALMIFPFNTKAVEESTLAPLCKNVTKSLVSLIPEGMKARFEKTYQDIFLKNTNKVKSRHDEETDHS